MFGEMTILNKIVLATDLSTASIAAVPVAIGLAKILKAEVTLLNVFQYVPHHRYQVPVGWMVDIIRKDVQAKLRQIKCTFDQADSSVRHRGDRCVFLRSRFSNSLMPATHAFLSWAPTPLPAWTASFLDQRRRMSYVVHIVR